jgi:adenylyltransferase/sulfurtransferase
MRVSIIGVGGIGSHLVEWVARYLASLGGEHTLTVVDGDAYEDRNAERQSFDKPGNKAEVKARELAKRHPGLRVDALSEFLTPENADFILLEDEIVLICVDNHKTRKLVSDVAATKTAINVISGGNELEHGDVMVYLRREGRDLTPPFTQDRPEIAEPQGKAPYEMSCEELAASGTPQIIFANLNAAVVMANAFWRLVTAGAASFVSEVRGMGSFKVETAYNAAYFDMRRNLVMSRLHEVQTRELETEEKAP